MNTNELAHEMSAIHDLTLDTAREAVATYVTQLADLDGRDAVIAGRDGSHDELTDSGADDVRVAFTAEYGRVYGTNNRPVAQGGTATTTSRNRALQQVAELTAERDTARQAYESADGAWRDAIRAALAAGCTRTEIAAEAGVTRQRVVQIDERRR